MRGRLGSVDSFERCSSLASDRVRKELSLDWCFHTQVSVKRKYGTLL